MPGPCLPADVAIDADRDEAEALVQGDARLVGKGDAGTCDPKTLGAKPAEQLFVEVATDSSPSGVLVYVDRDVG